METAEFKEKALLNVRELAHYLGLSKTTVYQMARAGRLPGVCRMGRRSLRFVKSEIDKHISEMIQNENT
jgi:excisionase family DNA binding protein